VSSAAVLDGFLKITSSIGLPALALAGVVAFLQRRRHRVDRAEVIEGITVRVAERLDKDVDRLSQRLSEAQEEAASARNDSQAVRRELADMDRKARALMRALDESHQREQEQRQAREFAEAEAVKLRAENAELTDELARRRQARGNRGGAG
jgi:chromosome segregation ATPase